MQIKVSNAKLQKVLFRQMFSKGWKLIFFPKEWHDLGPTYEFQKTFYTNGDILTTFDVQIKFQTFNKWNYFWELSWKGKKWSVLKIFLFSLFEWWKHQFLHTSWSQCIWTFVAFYFLPSKLNQSFSLFLKAFATVELRNRVILLWRIPHFQLMNRKFSQWVISDLILWVAISHIDKFLVIMWPKYG